MLLCTRFSFARLPEALHKVSNSESKRNYMPMATNIRTY
jgi:hypothetical protein